MRLKKQCLRPRAQNKTKRNSDCRYVFSPTDQAHAGPLSVGQESARHGVFLQEPFRGLSSLGPAWETATSPGELEEGEPRICLNTEGIIVVLEEQQTPESWSTYARSGSVHLLPALSLILSSFLPSLLHPLPVSYPPPFFPFP